MIEFEEEDNKPGSPAWMATFADLMSLLMCFFVLLLSFSEMDVLKYKQIAGSMKNAFGVQNEVKVKDIPKGTSVIAREFSPGKPDPTLVDTVKQVTADTTKASLQVGNPDNPEFDPTKMDEGQTAKLLEEKLKSLVAETEADAEKLREILKHEVELGQVDIESKGRSITVRIRENGSFPSGSATLASDFVPVMASLREALVDIDGKIAVEGHTDNIPITSARFTSNWDLSASRALSVTHELIKDEKLDDARFMVIGHADTRPFQPNDTAQNRAKNRRVEIVIRQGLDSATTASINELKKDNPSAIEALDLNVEDIVPQAPQG
tara:strand:- start:108903 stop:109868 length:966 start_codon:yes stop_codon:yes gene_type:complete